MKDRVIDPVSYGFGALTILVAAGLGYSAVRLGNYQFGGMDGGITINTAWMLHLGFTPYRDLITATPPIYMIGCRLAFALGGVNWASLHWASAVLTLLTLPAQVWSFRRLGLNRDMSLFFSVAIQLVSVILVTAWWYNTATMVISEIFLSAALTYCRIPSDAPNRALLVIVASLLAISKANLAAPILASTALVFVATPRLRRPGLALFAIAACLSLLILTGFGINPLDVLRCYCLEGGRAFELSRWIKHLTTNDNYPAEVRRILAFLAISAVGIEMYLIEALRKDRSTGVAEGPLRADGPFRAANAPYLAIVAIVMFMTVFATATNNSFNTSETPTFLVGLAGVYLLFDGRIRSRLLRVCAVSHILVGVTLLAADSGRMTNRRLGVLGIGENSFFEWAALTKVDEPPFFRGLYCGPIFRRVLQEIPAVLKAKGYWGNPSSPVYFGPRIDYSYAAYGIRPQPGFPLWWEAFNDPNKPMTRELVNRFKACNYETCIFLKNDYILLHEELKRFPADEFVVENTRGLTVHSRKGSAPVTPNHSS